ncbi:MAG: hypothetical protein HXX20_11795 [Chloroflexi bacterium]|nr:hypothetical protein [Chloroflexota bacterium]
MKLLCSHCHQGRITAHFSCDSCHHPVDLETVLHYERLTFLLEETSRPNWQAWQPTGENSEVLRPYRQAQREVAYRLNLLHLTDPQLLQVRCLATEHLLKELAALESPTSDQLRGFINEKRDKVIAEYIYQNKLVPIFNETLGLNLRKAVWQTCLRLLQKGQHLIAPSTWQKLVENYEFRLHQVEIAIQAEANERTAQQALLLRQQEEARQTQIARQEEARQRQQLAEAKPLPTPTVTKPQPAPRLKFNGEKVWNALLSDVLLRTLLYMGALFVVLGACLFTTLNWNQFPPLTQINMLLGVDLAFFGASIFTVKKLQLRKSGLTFLAISAAILPVAIYGYSRPELLNLDSRGTWSWVALLTLPVYLALTWVVVDKLFSFMSSLAILNAWFALLFQLGVAPEWLAPASIPVAALLVWLDGQFRAKTSTEELADAPFWIGQLTVIVTTLALFSYYLRTPKPGEMLQWALGLHWWLVVAFYGWCVKRTNPEQLVYRYGLGLSGLVALYFTLQKLPLPHAWQGFCLGLLGLGYLAWQNFSDLVNYLNFANDDHRQHQPWPLSEILAARKPFSTLGWIILAVSLSLSWVSGSTLALAASGGLLALALSAASLIYRWPLLAYFGVGGGLISYFLVCKAGRAEVGVALLGAASLSFGLWLLIRRNPLLNYFRLPLQIAGHLTALLILVNFGLANSSLFLSQPLKALNHLVIWEWLGVAAIYAGLSAVYRKRISLDFALVLVTLVLTGKSFNDASLRLVVLGFGLVVVGFGATQRQLRNLLQQWGYGLATVGLLLNLTFDYNHFNFLVCSGLYILLALGSALAAYHGKLFFYNAWLLADFSKEEPLWHLAISLWLYPAFSLLPFWLQEVFGSDHSGLGMAELAILYFLAGWGLARFGVSSAKTKYFGPYSYPALLGWLVLGLGSLYQLNDVSNNIGSVLVSLALTTTAIIAALVFKEPRFNWLVVNLLPWANWKIYQWSELPLFWEPLFIAGLATLMLACGEILGQRAGKSYRWTAHQQTATCILVSLLMYTSTFTSINSVVTIKIALSALLVLLVPYTALALLRRKPSYVYMVSLIISLVIIIWGKCSWLWLGWAVLETIVWGYLGLTILAAALYPASLRFFRQLAEQHPTGRKSAFPPRAVLSQMSHFWAGSTLLFAQVSPETLNLVLVVLALLYLLRSYYQQQARFLAIAAGLSGWAFWHILGSFGISTSLKGVILVGLAAFYLVSGLLLKLNNSNEDKRFHYNRRAWQVCYSAGVAFYLTGLLLSSTNNFYAALSLGLMTVIFGLMAWLEQREWFYLAFGNFLAAYTLSFSLLGLTWSWFGLALLLPAAVSLGLGLRLAPPIGLVFKWGALGLLLAGFPFALANERLLLAQNLLVTIVSLIALRITRQVAWLSGTLVASTAAGFLAISLVGVSWADFGLAGLTLVVLQLVGLLYIAHRATWLTEADRAYAITLLAISMQALALFGLGFSQTSFYRLAWNLTALSGIYLFNLLITRQLIWLSAALAASHLTYLATLAAITKPSLTLSQLAFALLVAGVLLAIIAVRLGHKTENLQQLTARFRSMDVILIKLGDFKSWSLPFYLATALDLGIALFLASGESFNVKLAIGGSVALCLGVVALCEQNKAVGWLSLGLVVMGAFYLCTKVPLTQATVALALMALSLTSLGYGMICNATTKLLAEPTRQVAHLMAGSAALVWSYSLLTRYRSASHFEGWESLSWLLGIIGLNYLIVSRLEDRRQVATTDESRWRYLSYGAVMFIEAWFSLRLGLNSVNQLQFYVIPLGLVCLVFGWQERNGRSPRTANLLEGLGLTILLSTTLMQAFGWQTFGLGKTWYGIWLLLEGLLVLGFGAARRLRYYFFGGLAALLLDLAALSVDPIRATDKWVVLGLTGLVLIGLALFLERKRESVILISKNWFGQLHQWE